MWNSVKQELRFLRRIVFWWVFIVAGSASPMIGVMWLYMPTLKTCHAAAFKQNLSQCVVLEVPYKTELQLSVQLAMNAVTRACQALKVDNRLILLSWHSSFVIHCKPLGVTTNFFTRVQVLSANRANTCRMPCFKLGSVFGDDNASTHTHTHTHTHRERSQYC